MAIFLCVLGMHEVFMVKSPGAGNLASLKKKFRARLLFGSSKLRFIMVIGPGGVQESDFLVTSMITDRIGRLEVLLPINHNYDKIC